MSSASPSSRPVPVPLVAGFLLLLVAPATLHYIASTPMPTASALAASSLPPGFVVDVQKDGLVVSGVTVSAPWSVIGNAPDGAEWDATDTLVSVTVTSLGLSPRTTVQLTLPDGSVKRADLAGTLRVDGDLTEQARIRVVDGAATPFEALVTLGQPSRVTATLADDVTVTHETPAIGQSFADDLKRDPAAFVARNPIATVSGLPAGTLPAGVGYPALIGLQESRGGVTFSMLGTTVALDGATLAGDALADGGMSAVRGGDEALVTVRASPPSTARGTLRLEVQGPAVALIVPGATRLALDVGAGHLPYGVAVLTAGAAGASTDDTVQLVDATSGRPIVSLTRDGASTVYANAPLGAYASVPALAFESSTDGSGATTVVGRTAAGQEAVRVRHAPGEPGRTALTFGPGWPKSGVSDVDFAFAAATGLVTVREGDAGVPAAFALAKAGETPFFRATRLADGSVRVEYPGQAEVVPGGRLRIGGDPWSLQPFTLNVEQAGASVVAARVEREPLLAGSNLYRPAVTVTNAFEADPVYVAPPIALTGDLAARRLEGAVLYSPADPSVELLRIARTSTGFRVTSPLGSNDVGGALFTYEGDPVASNAAVLRVKHGSGGTLATATLDREAGTLRLSGFGPLDGTHHGHLQYAGDPLNPTALVVVSPADGSAVLRYDKRVGGAGGSVKVLGDTVVSDTNLLRIEGDPRDPRGFAFVVRDGSGNAVQRVDVSNTAAAANAVLPPEQYAPVVSMIESDAVAADYLTRVATVGGVRIDAAALETGTEWLPLAGPHEARLLVPAADDSFTSITLRFAADAAPGASAPAAAFTRTGATDPRAYSAVFAPDAAGATSGDALHLVVQYHTELSPLVVQTAEESGYSYRLDGVGPVVTLQAPTESSGITFTVGWSGVDRESGVASFSVERRIDGGPWEPWIEKTTDTSATFSGDAGHEYAFRARGVDRVGNAGAWSAIAATSVSLPAGADPSAGTNSRPSVLILEPLGDETLTGVVTVAWEAADPDGTTPIVNLYASADGGRTWKSLYSGTASSYAWDTTREASGTTWKLKAVASDGSLEDLDSTGRFEIRNVGVAGGLFGGDDEPLLGGGDGSGDGGSGDGGSGDGAGDGSGDGSGEDDGSGVGLGSRSLFIVLGMFTVLGLGLGVAFFMRSRM